MPAQQRTQIQPVYEADRVMEKMALAQKLATAYKERYPKATSDNVAGFVQNMVNMGERGLADYRNMVRNEANDMVGLVTNSETGKRLVKDFGTPPLPKPQSAGAQAGEPLGKAAAVLFGPEDIATGGMALVGDASRAAIWGGKYLDEAGPLGRGWDAELGMSVNAADATARGLKTDIQIGRQYGLTAKEVTEAIGYGDEWHHVGKGKQKRQFYDPDGINTTFLNEARSSKAIKKEAVDITDDRKRNAWVAAKGYESKFGADDVISNEIKSGKRKVKNILDLQDEVRLRAHK